MLIVRYYRYDERIVTLHLSPHPHLVLVAHHHAVLRITAGAMISAKEKKFFQGSAILREALREMRSRDSKHVPHARNRGGQLGSCFGHGSSAKYYVVEEFFFLWAIHQTRPD